jgi:hypothetical protein
MIKPVLQKRLEGLETAKIHAPIAGVKRVTLKLKMKRQSISMNEIAMTISPPLPIGNGP